MADRLADDEFDLEDFGDDEIERFDDLLDAAPSHISLHDAAHVWHPYTQHHRAPMPVPIARAKGAWLYDASGRAILDAVSSWWVTTHGHGREEIVEAIAEQARTLDHVMFARVSWRYVRRDGGWSAKRVHRAIRFPAVRGRASS